MAAKDISAMTQLNDITECCICLKTFTDPRMLPCIHTFCLQCLEEMAEKSDKKPGDEMHCPVCRKAFPIPGNGVKGTQINFFMTSMVEVRKALNQSNLTSMPCDVCRGKADATELHISRATLRCVECQENLCEGCGKTHKTFKMSRNHKILSIDKMAGKEEAVKSLDVMNCDIHRKKALDYYCAECKKVVCVSCFVESHKTHDCKDVATVEEEFRQIIKKNAEKISMLAEELLAKKEKSDSKEDFLKKIVEKQKDILKRRDELNKMIEQHAEHLLRSLEEIKNRRLKAIQTEEDELERQLIILESYKRYCDELRSKGSASDVCRGKDELLRRANELEEDYETYIMRPSVSLDVTFLATDLNNLLTTNNGNIIGSLQEEDGCTEDFAVLIGETAGRIYPYKIGLNRPNEITPLVEDVSLPPPMTSCVASAVYNNTMFITGIGNGNREIWKYNFASGWNKCGSLRFGRENHCSEFIGERLYICGGRIFLGAFVLKDIECYNVLTEGNALVGNLKFRSSCAACVAYKGSIYVFGGLDTCNLDCVQVFNPADNTCTLLITNAPQPFGRLRAVSWNDYAILLSCDNCFMFDFKNKTWQERKHFKRKEDPRNFGIILHNQRLFIIEDKECGDKASVWYTRAASIFNNETPNWKFFGKLPKPPRVIATAQLSLFNNKSI